MKDSKADNMLKRARTFEETAVETAVYLGIFLAFGLFTLLLLFTPLLSFLNSRGAAWAVSGLSVSFLSLHATCSVFWGLWFRFSMRQFGLLSRFILIIDLGISMFALAYSYVIFILLYETISNPNYPAIWIVGGLNLLLICLLIALKRVFGKSIGLRFRIKYIPDNVSFELASESIKKAEQQLAKKNHEEAAHAFHSAAITYVNLERWKEAGENYLRAADAYSLEKDMAFGASYTYGLAAASFILGGSIDDARNAIETGDKTLKTCLMPEKAKQRASYLFELLTTICEGDNQKVEELWKSLGRKVRRWGYPTVEETILLIERNLETLKSRSAS